MKKIYRGRCHCGAVRFAFRSEEIASGRRCNCSICVRKGAIMSAVYFPPEDFVELAGLDALTVYQWGDQEVYFYFCKTCGIAPFHDTTARPGHYRVNLGCVDELDAMALPIEIIDGRSF